MLAMKHLTRVAPNAFMAVLHIQTENQHIQLTVQSTHTFTHCPTCATVSSRIPSRSTCLVHMATRISTERLKGIQSYKRRTQRVEDVLRKNS